MVSKLAFQGGGGEEKFEQRPRDDICEYIFYWTVPA